MLLLHHVLPDHGRRELHDITEDVYGRGLDYGVVQTERDLQGRQHPQTGQSLRGEGPRGGRKWNDGEQVRGEREMVIVLVSYGAYQMR